MLWTEPRSATEAPGLLAMLEAAGCTVRFGNPWGDRANRLDEDTFAELVSGAHGILMGGRDRLTRRVLEAASDLVVVCKTGVGVNRIDVAAATELGVLVVNTPLPEQRDAVAEYTVALLLGLVKHLRQADRRVRALGWARSDNLLLSGRNAGLVGYGRIGRRVATMLRALGMSVLFNDPHAGDPETRARSTTMDRLLAEADVVSLHAVPREDGRPLLDADAIRRMKPGAVVVNTARGELIDEHALARAIRDGLVWGAALDVLSREPADPASPLLAHDIVDRVLLSPHSAGIVPETTGPMIARAAESLLTALRGQEPPQGVVNEQILRTQRWRGSDRRPQDGEGDGRCGSKDDRGL